MPEDVMLSVRNILEESIVVSGKCVLDARPGGIPKNHVAHATPSYVEYAVYVGGAAAPVYVGGAAVALPLAPPGALSDPPPKPGRGDSREGGCSLGGGSEEGGCSLGGGSGGGAAPPPPSPTVLNCFSCDHDYRIYRRVVMDCCGKGGCLKCLGMWFFHYGKNCPFCNSEKAVKDDTNKIVEISSDIERIILDVGANPALFEFLGNTRPSCGAPLLPQTYSAPLNNVQRRNVALLTRLPLGARRKRFGPMCTWYLIFALLLILITIGAIVSAAVIIRIWA